MNAAPQGSGLRRFSVEVAHPVSGAESSIVINAASVEEARKMVNDAGLLVCSVSLVAEDVGKSSPADFLEAMGMGESAPRRPLRQSRAFIEVLIALIPWLPFIVGMATTIYGVFDAVFFGGAEAKFEIGVGLFIQGVFAAYT